MQTVVFEVKDGNDNFKTVGTAQRAPRWHAGWQSVTYKGNRYQLHGGIRNPLFINIKAPALGGHDE